MNSNSTALKINAFNVSQTTTINQYYLGDIQIEEFQTFFLALS